jgi:hypothetical protein
MLPDDGDREKYCCLDDWVRDGIESIVNPRFLLNIWKSFVWPQSGDHREYAELNIRLYVFD